MLYGFTIAYIFTGDASDSAGIVLLTGTTLTLLQWGFEIAWDKYVREVLRYAISRKQGRTDWLVWWRRGPRTISMDVNEQRALTGKETEDPEGSQDAS